MGKKVWEILEIAAFIGGVMYCGKLLATGLAVVVVAVHALFNFGPSVALAFLAKVLLPGF